MFVSMTAIEDQLGPGADPVKMQELFNEFFDDEKNLQQQLDQYKTSKPPESIRSLLDATAAAQRLMCEIWFRYN
jgi:hypothetical protein